MTINELFTALSSRGLTVQRADDGLQCRGDQSKITDEMQQALRAHRRVFLQTLPQPMTAAEIEAALDDLRAWLNEQMPTDYRLSCNEAFWAEFDRSIEKAVAAMDATAFNQFKAEAKAEFHAFSRMLQQSCTICSAVPSYSCACDWSVQIFSENGLQAAVDA